MSRHNITPEVIDKIAALAHLELTDEESTSLGAELADIVSYMVTINQVAAASEGAAPPSDAVCVLAADTPGQSLGLDSALAAAPAAAADHFCVPLVKAEKTDS